MCFKDIPPPHIPPSKWTFAECPINIDGLSEQFSSIHFMYSFLCFFKGLVFNQCISLSNNNSKSSNSWLVYCYTNYLRGLGKHVPFRTFLPCSEVRNIHFYYQFPRLNNTLKSISDTEYPNSCLSYNNIYTQKSTRS